MPVHVVMVVTMIVVVIMAVMTMIVLTLIIVLHAHGPAPPPRRRLRRRAQRVTSALLPSVAKGPPATRAGRSSASVASRISAPGIEPVQALLQLRNTARLGEIGLGQDQPVGHGGLAHCLFMSIERCLSGHRIDDGDEALNRKTHREIGVVEHRMQDRRRIGETRGFDHDAAGNGVMRLLSRLRSRSSSVWIRSPRTEQHRQPAESRIMPSSTVSTSM